MRLETTAALAALLLTLGSPARADDAGAPATADRAVNDTGRFYLFVEAGQTFHLEERFVGDVDIDTADGFNFNLGGGGGYNITDHWGVEIQANGIEPDLRSASLGKVKELSNITLVPAIRYRWKLLDGRLVPWASIGFGWSMSDINDTGNLRVHVEMDEQTYVGTLSAGLEYFVADDVAVGFAARYFGSPKQDAVFRVLGPGNRELVREESQADLSNVAILLGLRLFPGQPAAPGQPRRLLLADHGPYDTDETRAYLYALGGHSFVFDDSFADGVDVEAPGDFNATLGGGLGVNLNRNWAFEVQVLNTEPNLDAGLLGGKIAELSNTSVLPTVRYRVPLRAGRLVPYGFAGLGAAFNQVNDARVTADVFYGPRVGYQAITTPKLRVDETSVAGVVGIGLDYFLNHHIAVGLSLPYYIYPDWDTAVLPRAGTDLPPVRDSVNLSGLALLFHVKVYLP